MARVFARQRTWLDPVLRPVRAAALPAHRRRRDARDALDRVRRRAAPLQRRLDAGALRDAAPAGSAAVQPAGLRGRCRRPWRSTPPSSFTTNTNWQAYGGESTMSYFTQMAGLAYHNFVSAAVGIAVAIAFIRGIAQKEKDTLGNFWVDMVRALALGAAADLDRRRAVPRVAGRRAEPQAVRQGRVVDPQTVTTTGADGKTQSTASASRRSRRVRWPRRRSSSSSAPTAAASSTPTARTRSRTRRR